MLNPDEQYTYLSYPPEAINSRDYSELPEFNQERMPEALDFFRGQFIAMGRPSDARNIEEMGCPPMRMFSSIADASRRHVGLRIPVLVKKNETANWNPATKTYEIRQR